MENNNQNDYNLSSTDSLNIFQSPVSNNCNLSINKNPILNLNNSINTFLSSKGDVRILKRKLYFAKK